MTEDVRITGGKFTLDLNGKTATVPDGLTISGTTDIGIQNGKIAYVPFAKATMHNKGIDRNSLDLVKILSI